MKKYFFGTLAAIALTLCISSCGNPAQEEQTAQNASEEAEITAAAEIPPTETTAGITEKVRTETVKNKDGEKIIFLETPVIFASCLFDDTFPELKGRSLVLEMTEGSYNSYNGHWDRAWEGSFRFRLTKSDKNSHYEILDSDIISCPLELGFNEQFEISVDDYNNDGSPDFAINQWGSLSGGTNCYLFTLPKDRKVRPINYTVNDEQSKVFWLPKTYRSIYSPGFEKEGENCFSVSRFTYGGVHENELFLIPHDVIDDWFSAHNGFDMSEFTLKNIYEWGNEAVVLKEQQILEPDGSIWYSSND